MSDISSSYIDRNDGQIMDNQLQPEPLDLAEELRFLSSELNSKLKSITIPPVEKILERNVEEMSDGGVTLEAESQPCGHNTDYENLDSNYGNLVIHDGNHGNHNDYGNLAIHDGNHSDHGYDHGYEADGGCSDHGYEADGGCSDSEYAVLEYDDEGVGRGQFMKFCYLEEGVE